MTVQHLLASIPLPTALALIVGYFSAHAAGLLTKAHAPAWTLGAVTTVLATLAAVIPTVVIHPGDNWRVYLGNVFLALLATTLGHKSQIPSALKAHTPGIVGSRHRTDTGAVIPAVALVVLIILVALLLGFAVNHFFLLLLILLFVVWLL